MQAIRRNRLGTVPGPEDLPVNVYRKSWHAFTLLLARLFLRRLACISFLASWMTQSLYCFRAETAFTLQAVVRSRC